MPSDGNTYYVQVSAGGGATGDYEIMAALLVNPAADLRFTTSAPSGEVVAGTERMIVHTVTNAGPSAVGAVEMQYLTSPSESLVGMSTAPGWTCTPVVAGIGRCATSSLGAGATATFTRITRVHPDAADVSLAWGGYVGAFDPPSEWWDLHPQNNTKAYSAPIVGRADLTVGVSAPPSVPLGEDAVFVINPLDAGPSFAASMVVTVTLSPQTAFQSLAAPAYSCTAPPAGSSGTISCSSASFGPMPGSIAVSTVPMPAAVGAVVGLTAFITSATADPVPGNNTASASTVLTRVTADDTDGDGLTDAFEDTYGLDGGTATGADGPFGDPDGDGKTNLEEQEAETHPRGFHTRFFAEGSTGDFFDERLALLNVDATQTARVLLRYLRPGALPILQTLTLGPHRRGTIDVETVDAGLARTAVSVAIESDVALAADRLMRWDATGYGAHGETAVASPATTWYLAEGSTLITFQLFYLLQNPSATDATVTVTYLLPAPAAPLVREYALPANSRQNIWVNLEAPELAHTDVSAAINSTVPIIVERAMYLNRPGQDFAAGHDSMGVTAPALSWFLAEGATGPFFDLFLLFANPGASDAVLEARYLKPDGSTVTRSYTVAAQSRSTVWVDLDGPELADTAVSTVVTSTNGVPVIVERAMWWGDASGWYEAHNSAGATQTGTLWAVAGGEVNGPYADVTYVLVANTSDVPARLTMQVCGPDQCLDPQELPTLPAHSRFNVPFEDASRHQLDMTFGVLIESIGDSPAQIVVEEALYRTVDGVSWAAGTNSLGTRLR